MRIPVISVLLCIIAMSPVFCISLPENGTAVGIHQPPVDVHSFSFDVTCLLIGLSNNGWGLGIKYEQKVLPHLSMTGGFSHTTLLTDVSGIWCTTVGISLGARYYPSGPGLRAFFSELCIGTDFLNYFGDVPDDDNNKATLISLIPTTGWRFLIYPHTGLDLSCGYKYFFYSDRTYGDVKKYISSGIQLGISFKKIY